MDAMPRTHGFLRTSDGQQIYWEEWGSVRGVTAVMPLGSLLAGLGVQWFGLTASLLAAAAAYLIAVVGTGFGERWKGF